MVAGLGLSSTVIVVGGMVEKWLGAVALQQEGAHPSLSMWSLNDPTMDPPGTLVSSLDPQHTC